MAKTEKEPDKKSGFLKRVFGGGKSKKGKPPSKPESNAKRERKQQDISDATVSASEKKSSYTEMGDPKWSVGKDVGAVSEKKYPGNTSPLESIAEELLDSPADIVDQGLRIIVPVDIQAYVVTKSSIKDEIDTEKVAKKKSAQKNDWLKPDTKGSSLPKGIHLHWAMPDALMVGEENDNVVNDEASLEEMQTFPHLPNRWLVVRQWPDKKSPQDKNLKLQSYTGWKSKAWVINANDKTATELSQWNSPGLEDSSMTAIDDGDPATADDALTWTAVYEESKGRFTFHDTPEPKVQGPLNYMVAGWYSKASQDPLYCQSNVTRGEWKDRLEELEWSVIEREIIDRIGIQPISGSIGGVFSGK
jgi:hypothetical protein